MVGKISITTIVSAFILVSVLFLTSVMSGDPKSRKSKAKGKVMPEVVKSDEEWRSILTPEQYHVTREKGTERPFTGKYDDFFEKGTYKCIGCGANLFKSDTKFDAGCGWPSFYDVMDENNVQITKDYSHGMIRDEVTCRKCGAHLGHVFPDGPKPTGQRYCINSASINFEKE